jgi:uncharacterized membrane protein
MTVNIDHLPKVKNICLVVIKLVIYALHRIAEPHFKSLAGLMKMKNLKIGNGLVTVFDQHDPAFFV